MNLTTSMIANQGRVMRQFEPYHALLGNNGKYVSLSNTEDHTLIEYEPSPLNRKSKVTPPFLGTTEYIYGANTSGDLAGYNHFSLNKVTVKDGNGNQVVTLADKKGRKLLGRRLNSSGSSSNDIQYLYDDKDRLTTVLPPGVTMSDAELKYIYTYDGRDNGLTKNIPGKDLIECRYNSRDFLSYQQDGYLRGQGKWYGWNYDTQGRETTSGFANQAGNNNTHTSAVIDELLTENIYGTLAHEKDKLKTSKSKVLGTSDWLETTLNYDACGRILSSDGNSIVDLTSGSVQHDYEYDWMGNMLKNTLAHVGPAGTQNIIHSFTFDKVGREDLYHHSLNGTNMQISNLDFDHKEQLIQLALGPLVSKYSIILTRPMAYWRR